jgi:hypothetical protein
MRVTCKRWLLAVVVGAALLAVAAPASAQVVGMPYPRVGAFRPYGYGYGPYAPNPYNMNYPLSYPSPGYPAYPSYGSGSGSMYSSGTNPYLGSSGTASLVSEGTTAQLSDPYLNPYTTNPYSYYYSPAGSYLSGAADLVTAQGNYLVQYQRASLLQEEVHRSMLDSRRKVWEEARYERASLMNSEQVRVANIQSALERARHDPPLTEIWSGQALNSLFDYLTAQQGKVGKGPDVPLTEDLLKHINLTTGKDGNVGLLKHDLTWPVTLQRPEFEDAKKKLSDQLTEAKRQAQFGPVNNDLASDIKSNVARMQDILLQHVSDIQPADYMTAKKYLNMLDESAKALNDPNVTKYFNEKWSAKGKNVAALIENLKGGEAAGLRFAPAAPGDEPAYRALYYALRDYDAAMTQMTSTPTRP